MKISPEVKAAIIAAAVLAVGTFFTIKYYRWQERVTVDNSYKETLAKLVRSHKDDGPDSPSLVGLFRELNDLIERKAEGDASLRRKFREDVKLSLVGLFKSQSFDFGQGSNVELETLALANWKEYSDHLTANPEDNLRIMDMYSVALADLARREPDFVRTVAPKPDGGMTQKRPVRNGGDVTLLQRLNDGYRMHFALLKGLDHQLTRQYFLPSFCSYLNATANPALAGYVFDYSQPQVEIQQARCAEAGLTLKALK